MSPSAGNIIYFTRQQSFLGTPEGRWAVTTLDSEPGVHYDPRFTLVFRLLSSQAGVSSALPGRRKGMSKEQGGMVGTQAGAVPRRPGKGTPSPTWYPRPVVLAEISGKTRPPGVVPIFISLIAGVVEHLFASSVNLSISICATVLRRETIRPFCDRHFSLSWSFAVVAVL